MINFLFLLSTFILFVMAVKLMSTGWGLMTEERPKIPGWKVHPEMEDVKPGDELLVVNFDSFDKDDDEEDDDGDVLIARP